MTNQRDETMIRLLREAMPPIHRYTATDDLWPRVRAGLYPAAPPLSTTEWILVAAVMLSCLLQPATISVLLFHL